MTFSTEFKDRTLKKSGYSFILCYEYIWYQIRKFSRSYSFLDRPKETKILLPERDCVLKPSRHCVELHNYAMITRNARDVNGERAVNTTFVVAQNATAARAAGYGDADYSLIWFTTYYPDELARDSQCAHNVWHNLLILLMAPAHYYWFRAAPRSDGRWFIPVVIAPMLNRPRTRSRESTMRRCASFFFLQNTQYRDANTAVRPGYVCRCRERGNLPRRDLQSTQRISEPDKVTEIYIFERVPDL